MKKKNENEEFGESDFIRHVWKEMKRQEKTNPAMALLHERLSGDLKLIGLTGGIASGKSTVSGLLKKQGLPVIDADRIARQIFKPGTPTCKKVIESFGKEIISKNASIDRAKLATIVFNNPAKKHLLESLTHPEIFRQILKKTKELRKKHKRIIVDAALLFESGLDQQMDQIILVKVSPEIQIRRLMQRDHLSEEEAQKRIRSQMPAEEKEKLAHFVIDNSGTREETFRQLEKIIFSPHGFSLYRRSR